MDSFFLPISRFLRTRKWLHRSGQLPLAEVFGEVPAMDRRAPPLKIYYSDVACQLKPHLRRYDAAVYKLVEIKLGEVHKVPFKNLSLRFRDP